jgi:hypothetical protein
MTTPVKEYRSHPEELAKQASRRMDATHGLAAIPRDSRKGGLLRVRSQTYCWPARRCRPSVLLSIAFSVGALT